MDLPNSLRLLANTNNDRGNLFTRLTRDLFFALGYDDLRLDVAKSGREIDIQGQHRHEDRGIIGECKAHARPIGGDDLNKFRGVLSIERDQRDSPVNGYFVSLNGFRNSAREQEDQASHSQLTLLDATDIIEELQRNRTALYGQNVNH